MFDKIIGPGLQKLRMMFNPMRTMLRKITEFFYARIKKGVAPPVPFKGKLEEVMHQLIGGLRAGMGYCGASNIDKLKKAKSGITFELSDASINPQNPIKKTIGIIIIKEIIKLFFNILLFFAA